MAAEFVEGETLAARLGRGRLSVTDAAHVAGQVASALAASHAAGISHRDLKPANIMLRHDGTVKVLDFGLARIAPPNQTIDDRAETQTIEGRVLGTLAYMSPEQARGLDLDWRTDIWSLGVILYEMLAGAMPFESNNQADLIAGILSLEPRPFPLHLSVPTALARLVRLLLVKDRDNRRIPASEVKDVLRAFWTEGTNSKRRSHKPILRALATLAVLGALGWLAVRFYNAQWARYEAIAQIRELADKGDYEAAFRIAVRAESRAPRNAALAELWPEISQRATIRSVPEGANVRWKPYGDLKAAWQDLGRTPLQNVRLPAGPIRLALTAPGYEAFECAFTGQPAVIQLRPAKLADGMVTVPAGLLDELVAGLGQLTGNLEEYDIDKYEVTNRDYRNFIDAGGYVVRDYWKQPFVRNGRVVRWEDAMREFVDSTGRPGPSGWYAGNYPGGQEDYPVGGVCWYEAAAYAEFSRKDLPTTYHWI